MLTELAPSDDIDGDKLAHDNAVTMLKRLIAVDELADDDLSEAVRRAIEDGQLYACDAAFEYAKRNTTTAE